MSFRTLTLTLIVLLTTFAKFAVTYLHVRIGLLTAALLLLVS